MPTSPTVQHLASQQYYNSTTSLSSFLAATLLFHDSRFALFLCSPVFPGPVVPVVHAGNHLEAFDSPLFRSVPLSYTFHARVLPSFFHPPFSPLRKREYNWQYCRRITSKSQNAFLYLRPQATTSCSAIVRIIMYLCDRGKQYKCRAKNSEISAGESHERSKDFFFFSCCEIYCTIGKIEKLIACASIDLVPFTKI